MKLIYIPLAFLVAFSLFGMLGLSGDFIQAHEIVGSAWGTSNVKGWYDENNHLVAYENGSLPVGGEPGTLAPYVMDNTVAQWENGTYHDGVNGWIWDVDLVDPSENTQAGVGFALDSSIGMLAIIGGIMLVSALVGIRFLGNGLAEESVSTVIKGGILTTIWIIFSATSLTLFSSIPLGPVFYFILSGIYTLGIINQIGHPGDD